MQPALCRCSWISNKLAQPSSVLHPKIDTVLPGSSGNLLTGSISLWGFKASAILPHSLYSISIPNIAFPMRPMRLVSLSPNGKSRQGILTNPGSSWRLWLSSRQNIGLGSYLEDGWVLVPPIKQDSWSQRWDFLRKACSSFPLCPTADTWPTPTNGKNWIKPCQPLSRSAWAQLKCSPDAWGGHCPSCCHICAVATLDLAPLASGQGSVRDLGAWCSPDSVDRNPSKKYMRELFLELWSEWVEWGFYLVFLFMEASPLFIQNSSSVWSLIPCPATSCTFKAEVCASRLLGG